MSIVIMNMSSFEIERIDAGTDEIGYTDWLPAASLQPYTERRNTLPQDMLAVDAESFLQKMYTYQH